MRHSIKHLVVTLFLFSIILPVQTRAQGGVYTEADVIKQAQKHFDNKNYEQALPLYSQIVSNQPENANYNYCLGVCLLKVDGNKADAVRFLTIATQSSETPINSWLYLGMALHQAYRFDEAITTLQTFRKSSGKQGWKESGGEQLIQMCQNAINLNNDLSLLRHSILQETVTNCSDVATHYKSIGSIGRFLKLPKEYETKQSKNRMECSQVFLTAKNNVMVYSAPGKTGQSGLDIYKVTRDQKGLWNFPEPISAAINTSADEAYPVLVNDGNTLYFSSKGTKSTGGYDVFRSDYDMSTGTWSEPVSMGSPVNSPADDFYYVPFTGDQSAYFASDRESPSGKCKVYTASIIKENRNFVTINGTFICPAGLDLSDAKVTILNADDRSLLAQFRTATQNGTYFLKLPSPSQLIYQVRLPGFNDMESSVTFEQPDDIKLIQEIIVKRETSGKESLKIVTKAPEAAAKMMVKNAETPNEAPQMVVQNRPSMQMNSGKSQEQLKGDGEIKNSTASGTKTASTVLAVSKTELVVIPETEVKTKKQATPETVTHGESKQSEEQVASVEKKSEIATKNVAVPEPLEAGVNPKSNEITPEKDKKTNSTTNEILASEVNTQAGKATLVDEKKSSTPTKQPSADEPHVLPVNPVAEPAPSADRHADSKNLTPGSDDTKSQGSVVAIKNADTANGTDEMPSMAATAAFTEEGIADKVMDQENTNGKSAVSTTPATETILKSTAVNTVEVENQKPATEIISPTPLTAANVTAENKVAPGEPVELASTSSKNDQKSQRKKGRSSSAKQKSKKVQEPVIDEIPAPPVAVTQEKPTLQEVIFKVQLGAFRDRQEMDVKKKFEATGIKELEYLKNNEGFLVVVTGNETDYVSAVRLKEDAIKKGIKDAFIVVYSGENRLPVNMVVFEE